MYRQGDRQDLSVPSGEPDHHATIHPERNQSARDRHKSRSHRVDSTRDSLRNQARKDNRFPDQSAMRQLHEPMRLVFLESCPLITQNKTDQGMVFSVSLIKSAKRGSVRSLARCGSTRTNVKPTACSRSAWASQRNALSKSPSHV